MCLDTNIEHTELNFGNKTLETNHFISYADLNDMHVDHSFLSPSNCDNKHMCLDVPSDCLPFLWKCFNTKAKFSRRHKTPSNDENIDEAIKKTQVKKIKCKISFPLFENKKKIKIEIGLKEAIEVLDS